MPNATKVLDPSSYQVLVAAETGELSQLKQAIKNGGNPNGQWVGLGYYYSSTALILAAFEGRLSIVQYLVENHKVELNYFTGIGNTALDCAYNKGHTETAAYLESKGAKRGSALKSEGEAIEILGAVITKETKESLSFLATIIGAVGAAATAASGFSK